MSDPYHWSFPQRSETMFMATIGIIHLIQIRARLVEPCKDNLLFFNMIFQALKIEGKSLWMFRNQIMPYQLILNQNLKVTCI